MSLKWLHTSGVPVSRKKTAVQGGLRVGIDASMLREQRSGVGNYVFNLLNELTALDSDCSFHLYSAKKISRDCMEFGDCTENIFPQVKGPLFLSLGLIPYLKRDRIEVLWGGNGFLPICTPSGVASVMIIYDLVHHFVGSTANVPNRMAHKLLQPLAVRSATKVVAISGFTAGQVEAHYQRRVDAVIHPRIDQVFSKPVPGSQQRDVRLRYSLPERFFLSLSTIEPRKNLASLLRAYVQLKQCDREVPTLVLAGKRGWLTGEIDHLIDQLAQDGSVRWLGFVPQEDVPALYAASELFIFVPIYEGFGMPVREALLAGARVLASDIPPLREAGGEYATYTGISTEAILQSLRFHLEHGLIPEESGRFDLSKLEVGSAERFLEVLYSAAGK